MKRVCFILLLVFSILTFTSCRDNESLEPIYTSVDPISSYSVITTPTTTVTTSITSNTTTTTDSTTTDSTTTAATTKKVISTTTTTAMTTKKVTKSTTTTDKKEENKVVLDVKNIQQLPELPAGCEITSSTIVLNYYGYDVSKMELIDYMPISNNFYNDGKKQIGPNPRKTFAGDPTKSYYGAYAPVIENTINLYLDSANSNMVAKDITGTSPKNLYKYIDSGIPVIVWATVEMKETRVGDTWYFEDGTKFVWTRGEHCLVLIGYTDDSVILSDPYDSRGTVEYSKSIFEKRYSDLFSQAVIIQ